MKRYDEGHLFDISNKRPKVLLLGNGPIIAKANEDDNENAICWSKVIKELDFKQKISENNIPYSIQATIATSDERDKDRRKKYMKLFGEEAYHYRDNDILLSLLSLPWDAILTTNYTYDLEYVLSPQYVKIKNKTGSRYVFTTSKSKNEGHGYIKLRDFNRFYIGEEAYRDIWHIHGEVRNKSSIVLTHDEYARQVNAILTYNSARGYEYTQYSSEVKFKSWLDYMILGDLYILGLGMDFSEFDLWWILNRRLRENTGTGKLYYYNPDEGHGAIYSAIKMLSGEHLDLGIKIEKLENAKSEIEKRKIKETNNKKYIEFYSKAINDLTEKICGDNMSGNF